MADKKIPKENRFNQAKSLKKDLIFEQELMHKLKMIALDLLKMPPDELEQFWPQASPVFAAKNSKKNEKEFLSSVILEAQINIQLAEAFKQRYDIDLNDARTKQFINQQAQTHVMGH